MLFTISIIKHKMEDKISAYNYFEQSKSMLKESKKANELAIKQNRSLTILGYINSVRMDCAKAMLINDKILISSKTTQILDYIGRFVPLCPQ